ncbi:hypothetical protein H2508_12985 [Parahaliea sp. F7430]|uniref:Secreted protein n=1 Tax=Sediminihaliea albiluteola TaxID=2758564 RepID=A0A7W2TY07_9GAMM|nr:hypothetical protein [Sediminihaliea albiluteola]MBA6414027.1 hypothetical protein [Sediminihaliea albiluteola]
MINWKRQMALAGAGLLSFSAHAGEVNTAEKAREAFMQAFKPFCGQAFSAQIVQDNAPSPAWDQPLVVHIRDCEDKVIRMPLHVGEDRSRTWVLTLTPEYIDFQHYHLHEDGSPDAVSPYGGKTLAAGSATAQSFPVDEASKALFVAEGLGVSVTNTWAIDFPSEQSMRYQLSRPGRIFEVEVDLSQPIPLPPPAWGYNPTATD